MQISKSDYMLFLKHPAWLWLKKHAKQLLPPVDASLQHRFDEGHAFEPFAEALFPNLTKLSFSDFSSYRSLLKRTENAWQTGATAVAQGRYESGPITCISDVVSRDGDSFALTEIKSSTSVKKEHAFDLAFQRIVLEAAGFNVTRCAVAHVNREYVRTGRIEPRELVAITDITQKVDAQIENTRTWIDQALNVVASKTMPDPAPELARHKSYREWMDIRKKLDPPMPSNSSHRLPFINAKTATTLIEAGITTLDQIDDPTFLGKSTQRYLRARADGARSVDQAGLAQFLTKIEYPVYYLDYETSQSLLPPWEGTRPYQQVPFQYSLHIQRDPAGEIEHREYLHRDESNPMPALLERLRGDVGETGTVLVWYEAFEKTRNMEMASAYPQYSDFLDKMNSRVIDLMKPFSDEVIRDPAFNGSASIKAVLPILLPELSYEDLAIREGSSASRLWKDVTLTHPDAAERTKVYDDLVAYCTLDTWAMVAIHRHLRDMQCSSKNG